MITYDLVRARTAVQILVDSPYCQHHIKRLRSTVVKPRAMPFSAELEPLNELLAVGRQSLAAMENLIAVAEFKRDDRNEYQRQYMAAKRQRDRKVVALEELMTGKVQSPEMRLELLHRQYDIWNKEKAQFLARFAGLSWSEKNEKTKEFWDRKEAEIDALSAEARARGPVKRKRVVHVSPTPNTAFGQKLAAAVRKS